MARKKGGGHGGGHGWFVTFADLMGLLMSFFVMLTAFSTQDQKKMQIVAGSMREAFGQFKDSKMAGIVEIDGLPVRPHLKHVERTTPDRATDTPGPRQGDKPNDVASRAAERALAMAAASLRQAMQDLPELAEHSKNILVEETADGLDIQIVDQDGRAMFGDGESQPLPRARAVLTRLSEHLATLGNPIRITGHAAQPRRGSRETDGWRLSTMRALNVRDLLAGAGVAPSRFESVAGRADSEPMFPDDPTLSANRRVSIVLVRQMPALPP